MNQTEQECKDENEIVKFWMQIMYTDYQLSNVSTESYLALRHAIRKHQAIKKESAATKATTDSV